MCGFAGLLTTRSESGDRLERTVSAMTATLAHRGPDAAGVWSDPAAGIALGHRRLAILDLSEAGAQPMTSANGRWVVAYNGEIYNFAALREELGSRGYQFRGSSDTEVLLATVDCWGPIDALRRCNGMFALALWDRAERTLHLARDRVGKKPLYYGWTGGRLAFASELKAFRALAEFAPALDRQALAWYLRYNAVPGTRSIYEGVAKVEPGAVRSIRPAAGTELRLTRFWSALDVARDGRARPFEGSGADLVDELDWLLRDAVRLRLESDVALGAFLSGGVDSSLVVALMQAQMTRPARTFSIGFEAKGWDEAPFARAVAEHLGTDHTELYVTAEEARAVIPDLPHVYDEPFCDSSQIPMLLVSKLAREHVTVSLSGDGGDELFAGYARYPFHEVLFRRFARVPRLLRVAAARGIAAVPWRDGRFGGLIEHIESSSMGHRVNRDRLLLLESLLRTDKPGDFYRLLLSTWREPQPVVLGVEHEAVPPLEGVPLPLPVMSEPAELASYLDLLCYLPDDILVKVDRATMAVGLEARAPILDHRVVALAWRIPYRTKVCDGVLKWPLKQVLARYVPRSLTERPKMGFGVPIAQWLRGPLRGWADDLLEPTRLRREGFFDAGLVARRWTAHRAGQRDFSPELWAILMFESWLDARAEGAIVCAA